MHACLFCLCKVSNLSQRVADLEGKLDRANRDKASLTNQLDDTVHKLTSQEQDNTRVDKIYFTISENALPPKMCSGTLLWDRISLSFSVPLGGTKVQFLNW